MDVLVLTQPGVPALVDGDAWVAIDAQNNKVLQDSSGDDGVAPDFAFVGIGYDGNSNHAQGYEASFPLAIDCTPLGVESTTWGYVKSLMVR